MTFFLRNISLSAFILAFLVGSFSVYISGRVVYEIMLNQVFSEKMRTVEAIGGLALEGENSLPSKTHDSLFVLLGAKDPGVLSVRVVHVNDNQVLQSTESSEIGMLVGEALPTFERSRSRIDLRREGDLSLVHISYLGSGDRLLWVTLNQSFFLNPAIVTGVQQAVVFVAAFGLFALIFLGIVRKFFLVPIRKLKHVLQTAGGQQENTSDAGFGELLESFSDIAGNVEATLERDKVVSETKSDFISTTAHQLRTPLSGINWALGALASNHENLTDEQKTLVERAAEKTKELIRVVGELLNAAGIEQGKFGFHPEQVELKGLVDKILMEEKALAEKNKMALRFDHADEAFPTVYVDKERIRWVIRNLIENAIRYGREGGEVVVSLSRKDQRLLVSVKDNGIGISPEAQQHIFQKFYRSNEAKRKRNDGTGIGLFIVRNIVNHHGGRIWFESVEGVGTTFFFTIPIAQDPTKKQPQEDRVAQTKT